MFASVPGYVQPLSAVQAALDAGADLTKGIAGIPQVHVTGESASELEITVTRGGALSGKALWDDGSPVPRMVVMVMPAGDAKKEMPPQFGMLAVSGGLGGSGVLAITDDEGKYRIAGLAPGSYRVKGTLSTRSQFSMQGGAMNLRGLGEKPLIVYLPATLHQKEAKAISVRAGEETTGEDLTLRLGGLHTVSGRIASLEDHHGINSATVELQDTDDKDFARTAEVDASGNFSVTFVPSGTYSLMVKGGEDIEAGKKKSGSVLKMVQDHTVRSYAEAKQSLVVGESNIAGLDIELTPEKTTKKDVGRGRPAAALRAGGMGWVIVEPMKVWRAMGRAAVWIVTGWLAVVAAYGAAAPVDGYRWSRRFRMRRAAIPRACCSWMGSSGRGSG